MTDRERNEQDDAIRASGADIVWVGLGTPKQDIEAERIATATNTTTVAIGAAFDFAAGTLREAPSWLSRAGLEWLFRLAMEPRRLWRRYLIGNLVFIYAVFRKGGQ
jgi:N-acetylglucosaminyldiphosphoundecaprenol N-acetyl-beta-D-mannosaminyltransferase